MNPTIIPTLSKAIDLITAAIDGRMDDEPDIAEANKILCQLLANVQPAPIKDHRRLRIIELARDMNHICEGSVEIDDDAILSEGDDNGCYVSAWSWVDFSDTEFDKSDPSDPSDEENECTACNDGSCPWCIEEKRLKSIP